MKIQLLVIAAVWALAGISHAQSINGSLTVNTPYLDYGLDGPGYFVSGGNSFGIYFANNLQSSSGDFTAPLNSDVGSDSHVISGLSSTPTKENVPGFLEFYTAISMNTFRFAFDLTSITETNAETGAFTGSGTDLTSKLYQSRESVRGFRNSPVKWALLAVQAVQGCVRCGRAFMKVNPLFRGR